MTESEWNPERYHQFSRERAQPALDLLTHIPDRVFISILDLGCGTGEHTARMANRWADSSVCGVDSSSAMLTKARDTHAGIANLSWHEADLNAFQPQPLTDLIFSNAALHWLDNHKLLFLRLAASLAPDGVLAVQMPYNFQAPSHQAMKDVASSGPWHSQLKSLIERPAPVHEPNWYYDALSRHTRHIDIWETTYTHVLNGNDPVARWTRSTGLKPYLDALEGSGEQDAFYTAYADALKSAYPKQADGRTLFSFRRLFILAEV